MNCPYTIVSRFWSNQSRVPSWLFAGLLALLGQIGFTPKTVQAQEIEWTQRNPSPRGRPAAAFDSARGVTVLFGGSGMAQFGPSELLAAPLDVSAWR